jgi:hypothetical protein
MPKLIGRGAQRPNQPAERPKHFPTLAGKMGPCAINVGSMSLLSVLVPLIFGLP